MIALVWRKKTPQKSYSHGDKKLLFFYCSDCAVKQETAMARSDEDAKRLWQVSEKLTGFSFDDDTSAGGGEQTATKQDN